MNAETIRQKKREIVERYGEWDGYYIHLGDNVYTIDNPSLDLHLSQIQIVRRILQMVSDVAGEPLERLRIVDLACFEGQYSIELALHGAQVVGIDGRDHNVARAHFAKEALGLDNLEFIQDDVRNLSREKYGEFDVVLCLGLLYHLNVPDVFHFMERVAEVCRKFAVIGTHVSMSDLQSVTYRDKTYWGRLVAEHTPDDTDEDKLKRHRASLDNLQAFWFTRASLFNLLSHSGFSSVYECHNPAYAPRSEGGAAHFFDYAELLAIKGERAKILSVPAESVKPANLLDVHEWPEIEERFIPPHSPNYQASTPDDDGTNNEKNVARKIMNKIYRRNR